MFDLLILQSEPNQWLGALTCLGTDECDVLGVCDSTRLYLILLECVVVLMVVFVLVPIQDDLLA